MLKVSFVIELTKPEVPLKKSPDMWEPPGTPQQYYTPTEIFRTYEIPTDEYVFKLLSQQPKGTRVSIHKSYEL